MCYNILTEVERTTKKKKRGKTKMEKEYIDFLFADEETGEEFFVELDYDPEAQPNAIKDLYPKAKKIAKENFAKPKYLGVYSKEDADMLGLDTY